MYASDTSERQAAIASECKDLPGTGCHVVDRAEDLKELIEELEAYEKGDRVAN